MFITCKLAALALVIVVTLHDQVHAMKIIGGYEVKNHSRPYMVLMQGGTKHCSGFLLNENFVMTAAHCQADSYKIYLGLHNIRHQEGVQHISVEKEFLHDNYSACYFINDIMLLKLRSKAIINDHVQPIALADLMNSSLPQSCSVAGWGHTEHSKYLSVKLMETNVKIIKNQKCAEKMTYCSSEVAGPGKGDSGGPLVCEDGRAYGVVSLNYKEKGNASAPTLSMYTKIAENRAWIDHVLQKNQRP